MLHLKKENRNNLGVADLLLLLFLKEECLLKIQQKS
jgi:hypothetical protein